MQLSTLALAVAAVVACSGHGRHDAGLPRSFADVCGLYAVNVPSGHANATPPEHQWPSGQASTDVASSGAAPTERIPAGTIFLVPSEALQ